MSLEPHYSLSQAVERFFPDGPITVSSLRNAIRAGELQATMPQGKLLVTEVWLCEWLNRCRVAIGSPAIEPAKQGHSAQQRLPAPATECTQAKRNALAETVAKEVLCKLGRRVT
jgi:hypothetical protein